MGVLIDFLRQIFDKMPYQVCIAVLVVIVITELTKNAVAKIEKKIEEKKGKEIKFFDHTKIIFSLFCSLVFSFFFSILFIFILAEFPLYFLAIVGASTILYKLVWKKIKGLYSN